MKKPLEILQAVRLLRSCYTLPLAVAPLFFCTPAFANTPAIAELANMSIEELAQIEVTSVSKKAERLSDAAASVYVITADQIRRSGATSLPDVLRSAPNLQVAQTSGHGYAISARGFNGSSSSAPNKLLVMIDGRSVYTPLFSGVFWDVQDVMLEDVERIEVISGPGGTLWGTNAVNGVINIITRSAADTQGTLVSAGYGTRGADGAARHGGKLGNGGNYRVYFKHFERRHTETEDGGRINDASHKSQAGFRADWGQPGEQFTLLGNVYRGTEEQPEPGSVSLQGFPMVLGDVEISGVNVLGRWRRELAGGSTLSVDAYYDHSRRDVPPVFDETLDIADIQLLHTMPAAGAHSLSWGAQLRFSRDRVINHGPVFAFLPANVNQRWYSLFAQDDIALQPDLKLTLGARIERNDYTGNEFLPGARLAWTPAPHHMLWTALSRAVRAPSRLDHDAFVPAMPPHLLNGGPGVRSEVAHVAELGYRGRPAPNFSYSATLYHSEYDHLRTQELTPSRTALVFANRMEGSATGFETWGEWQATPDWRLAAGFTALKEHLALKPGSTDTAALRATGFNPSNTWQLRSTLRLAPDRELTVVARHVAELTRHDVPSYTALDARFGWNIRPGLELSLTGRNLTGAHPEYGQRVHRSDLPRSIDVKLVWQQ